MNSSTRKLNVMKNNLLDLDYLEGTSTFKWYRDTIEIPGATTKYYTVTQADQGKSIVFEVTPISQAGIT